jgi:isoleucyl-tRNA synthetase
MLVFGASDSAGHGDEIAEELRVKEVRFETSGQTRVRLKPNLPVLGPRLGKRLPKVRAALEDGRYEVEGDRIVVDGEVLGPGDVLQEQLPVQEGWVVAADGELSVELDPSLDPELELEGRVLDLIHALNGMRKDAGLELTDRIRVRLPQSQAELLRHGDWIKAEVLAVEIETDGVSELQIEKV